MRLGQETEMCELSEAEVVIVPIGKGQVVGEQAFVFLRPPPTLSSFELVFEEHAPFSLPS